MQEVQYTLSAGQSVFLMCLLAISLITLIAPVVYAIVRGIIVYLKRTKRSKGIYNPTIIFSGLLIFSIFCFRYAVGYYGVIVKNIYILSWWEEIFNSIVHTLQTFSLDAGYSEYIVDCQYMLADIFKNHMWLQVLYRIHISVLNVVAPIAGGAIIFEILASIFPKIRLYISYIAVWKEKYFFSELNTASLAILKSHYAQHTSFFRPIYIFTDVYTDDNNEKSSELLLNAKVYGAICVKEDLIHVHKNKYGKRIFVLVDENEMNNIAAFANLANKENHRFLRHAKVYLFSQNDIYTKIEKQVNDILMNEYLCPFEELPEILPVQRYRNMICNMLVEIPLYEPLIEKYKTECNIDCCKKKRKLNVTILGTGEIGIEMFLSVYWFGQILDSQTHITIISEERKGVFWNKIDTVNPEIRRTTEECDDILKYSQNDYSETYCTVKYIKCDVNSSRFIELMKNSHKKSITDADYLFVALGDDDKNITVANSIFRSIGHQRIIDELSKKTVITYVVYDSELSASLNRKCRYKFTNNCGHSVADIYIRAVGSLDEIYNVKNIFMDDYVNRRDAIHRAYLEVKCKQKNNSESSGKDSELLEQQLGADYKFWANLARAMHVKYKAFSAGYIKKSIFDLDYFEDSKSNVADYDNIVNSTSEQYSEIELDRKYQVAQSEALLEYKKWASALDPYALNSSVESLAHKLAWLEHRRWSAFTRVKGFQCTTEYSRYATAGKMGSYKQMELKLHPCLVECDKKGIPIGKNALESPDFLDILSNDLKNKEFNDYDFKEYDYPNNDFLSWSIKKVTDKYNVTEKWVKKMCKKGKIDIDGLNDDGEYMILLTNKNIKLFSKKGIVVK